MPSQHIEMHSKSGQMPKLCPLLVRIYHGHKIETMLLCSCYKFMEVFLMIVFNKLGDYLKANNMKYVNLQKDLGLSPTIVAKFQKNRSVTTETIDKVCAFLKVQPGDIMEWIEDENELKKKEIERQIEALQKQLDNL